MKLSYESQAGSKYFYNDLGMYRLSNHWGRLANSKWRLQPDKNATTSKIKLGFAHYENFYPDNDIDAIYYLEYNSIEKTMEYNHKNNPDFEQKAILRTTFETRKRIKQARNILTLTSWAKHYNVDIDLLRNRIISELIFTNKPLEEIKRSLFANTE